MKGDWMMKVSKLAVAIAAGAGLLGAAGMMTAAMALPPAGTVYAFHSNATGSCPVLDWHVVSGDNGALNGMVSWDGMKSMAHVSGVIGSDGMIKMSAKEYGGHGRTAVVTGDAKNDGWLLLNIKGAHLDCENIKVPIWRSTGTQSGGGG
jgi:hypothetical protein